MAGGMDKDELIADMTQRLKAQFPGVDFNFSQYIQDNVEEAASGVKGENSVKLFGNDLAVLQRPPEAIQTIMADVPGIADLAVFNSLGQPTVRIDVDRARAARFGLAPGDVNAVVQAAIGGQAAGNLYEPGSDRNFPIMVRLSRELPRQLRRHSPHHHRCSESARRRRADTAGGCRQRSAGLRRLLHLPREPGTLHPDQILGAGT